MLLRPGSSQEKQRVLLFRLCLVCECITKVVWDASEGKHQLSPRLEGSSDGGEPSLGNEWHWRTTGIGHIRLAASTSTSAHPSLGAKASSHQKHNGP